MIGPGVGGQFGGDEYVVNVYLKGTNSGECNLLLRVIIEIDIFLQLHFRWLAEFVGNRVFNDDSACDVPLYFLFNFNIRANYVR